ncbi:glycosyltransferase family 4 protein [Sandarakinorhabdus sp. DWP1-3-1]|uniref:glycosyltransferase family 4 protein n=1 Tax=Sandarakinorhabdus sp. DWP1-3-1 TaxID=2804627 RepID=UPI003CEAF950
MQRFGGISTYWIELARLLAARPGVDASLLMPARIISGRADEIAAIPLPRATESLPPKVARYLPAPLMAGCDIQHSSYYRQPLRSPFQKRPASVVTVYDFIYERYRSGAARLAHTVQKRGAVAAADAVICISESTRNDLIARWPHVDPAKVVTVPLAVDHAAWFAAEVPPPATSQVLFVGQRGGYKRFDLAVAAVAALPELSLGIVGPALAPDELALLEARLPGRYRSFAGISNDELRRLYGQAHALLFPSDYEGFGLPLLEAMACGCPVVAAHQSCLPEVGGDAVIWAREQRADDYAAALAWLSDSDARRNAITAGHARAAAFTWDSTVDQTVAVYRQLISR